MLDLVQATHKSHKLYEITQVAEVYADAMLRDANGELMFLSCYGRDTAIKELMARIHLQGGKEGISQLTLVQRENGDQNREMATGYLMRPKELVYHSGRLPRGLFGQLVHAWIYHPCLLAPDKGAQMAWVIEHRFDQETSTTDDHLQRLRDKVWHCVKELSSVPLLDHWQTPVLSHIWDDMVFELGVSHTADYSPRLSVPIGAISACKVTLSDQFPQRICHLVRSGQLTLNSAPSVAHPQRLALAA
jgi:hypothetical protein